MSFISFDSYAFTGREMKAIAKYCGAGGKLLAANNSLYAIQKGSSSALRIKYEETRWSTLADGTKTSCKAEAFDKMEGDCLCYDFLAADDLFSLKVSDVVRIDFSGVISVDGRTDKSEMRPSDMKPSLEWLDRLFDNPVYLNTPTMLLSPYSQSSLAGLLDGFKFHPNLTMEASLVDTGFHERANADGELRESPCLLVKASDSCFGGSSSLGKREHMSFDFVNMGMKQH